MIGKFKKESGFTLIELLVVVLVLGVLAGVVLVSSNPGGQLGKGRDVQRKSDLRQVQTALEFYRSDVGTYPNPLPGCGAALTNGTTTYLAKMPCDPKVRTNTYSYDTNLTNTGYCLRACLENSADRDADANNGFQNNYSPNNPVICSLTGPSSACSGVQPSSYTILSP